MVQALVGVDPDPSLWQALGGEIAAPHLLDVEVLSALRGLVLGSHIDVATAELARRNYADFTLHRHELAPLTDRVWALRHQFTAYDATYVALAEGLNATLITCDAKLATSGHQASVTLIRASRR